MLPRESAVPDACDTCPQHAKFDERTRNLERWQEKQNGSLQKVVQAVEHLDDKFEHWRSETHAQFSGVLKAVAEVTKSQEAHTAFHLGRETAEAQASNAQAMHVAGERWSIQMKIAVLGITLSFAVSSLALLFTIVKG